MKLFLRANRSKFKFAKSYSTYSEAVLSGQKLAGYGNFYVDTGSRAPCREEQLLLPFTRKIKPKTKTKKQQILDSL